MVAGEGVELEKAVGWTTRELGTKGGKEKGKQVQRNAQGFVEDGLGVEEMLQQAVLDKAEEFLEPHQRVRIRPRAKDVNVNASDNVKEKMHVTPGPCKSEKVEVSTLLLDLNLNELLAADGLKERKKSIEIQLPLHLRYQPPSSASTTSLVSPPSFVAAYLDLLREILPSPLNRAFSYIHRTTFSGFSKDALPTTSSNESPKNDYVEISITNTPTLYLSCPSSNKYIEGFRSTNLAALFPPTPLPPFEVRAQQTSASAFDSTQGELPRGT